MIDGAPRVLFVPVSGPFGMGEYARCVALARAIRLRWPGAAVHFVLSERAPYATDVPFQATLLSSSATFHSAEVVALIERWRPDLVIFDNAGRTAQLRAAKRSGARVVYISARRRPRRKAFRMRWMRLIDEHWIAYPEFVAGPLALAERLKLAWLRRPPPRYLDVLWSARGASVASAVPPGGESARDYVLVVPGGGTGHPRARDALRHFTWAARELARAGIDTVYVGGPAASGDAGSDAAEAPPHFRALGSVPQTELAARMRGARLIVCNGGSTLLQAIACGKPCLAVPIAADQPRRIARCAARGVAVHAPLESQAIVNAALRLWRDAPRLDSLAAAAQALALGDGIDVALCALSELFATAPR